MANTLMRAVVWMMVTGAVVAAAGAAIDPERLERFTSAIEAQMEETGTVGMSVAVVSGGEVIYARGFGMADLDTSTPASPETIYAIGSSTKAFTSLLVAMQIAEGAMTWDDPIAMWVPELALEVFVGDPTMAPTISDCLSHQTGFTRMGLLWANGVATLQEIYEIASDAEPLVPMRTKFLYNNVVFAAAGDAVARAAGTSWTSLLERDLLRPLGMTTASVDIETIPPDAPLATGYRWDEEVEVFIEIPVRSIQSIAPAGAINGSVLDVARWIELQLSKGEIDGVRIAPEDAVVATWEPQITIDGVMSYARGWMVGEVMGHRTVEHGGNIDGYSANVVLFPDDDLGVVALTNQDAAGLPSLIGSLAVSSLLEEPVETLTALDGDADLVGVYLGQDAALDGLSLTVSLEDGVLFLDVPGQMNFQLNGPDDQGRRAFSMVPQIAVEFPRDAQGDVRSMILHQGGMAFTLPREGAEVEVTPIPDGDRYFGEFTNSERDMTLTILNKNGRLAIDVPGQMAYKLTDPDDQDRRHFEITDTIFVVFDETSSPAPVQMLYMEQEGEGIFFYRNSMDVSGGVDLEEVLTLIDGPARQRAVNAALPMRFLARASLPSSGLTADVTIEIPDAATFRTETDFGRFGRVVEVIGRDIGWSESSFFLSVELTGEALATTRRLHPIRYMGDWPSSFQSLSIQKVVEQNGRSIVILKGIEEGDLPISLIGVDLASGDVVEVRTKAEVPGRGIQMPMKISLSEHELVEGVRMPRRQEVFIEAMGANISRWSQIETNVVLPDDVLADPGEID